MRRRFTKNGRRSPHVRWGILYVGRACFQALIMICDILILIISDGFFLVMVIFDMHSVTVNILLSCSVSQTQIIYTFRFS